MDIGLKASFLEKALNLSFTVRDVLNSRSKNTRDTWGDNFYQENGNISSGRSYRLTLSYNFGNMGKKRPPKGNQGMNGNMGSEMGGGMDGMGGDMMTDF
jgi:hypothetical protein